MSKQVIRLKNKEGRVKHVNQVVFDAKGADFWKSEGWEIDPKPYLRKVTAKGVVYTLDKEAHEQAQEMHDRAEPKEHHSDAKEETPKPKRTRKPKE